MITNNQIDAFEMYANYFYRFLKNNSIKTFDELYEHLLNDFGYYDFLSRVARKSLLNTKEYEFKSLHKVVLNYENKSVLSRQLLFKMLDKSQNKDTFIKDLNNDIKYIYEILGNKTKGIKKSLEDIQDYIKKQKAVAIEVNCVELEHNISCIIFKEVFKHKEVIHERKVIQVKEENIITEVMEIENRIEMLNFLNIFCADIKRINYCIHKILPYFDAKVFFREDFVLVLRAKSNEENESLQFHFEKIDELISFVNSLENVQKKIGMINKTSRLFVLDLKQEENYMSLFEKIGSKKIMKLERVLIGKYNNLNDLNGCLRGIYEEVYENFI